MDLRGWITSDHASLLPRFHQSIAAHVPSERWTERADGGGASISHLLLHLSLHQDLAITTAVRGRAPLIATWRDRLGLSGRAAHDGLGEAEDPSLTALLDPRALMAYAEAVHAATGDWLATADLSGLDDVPATGERLDTLAGVTEQAVPWLHRQWDAKPVAFFVQWPAIGHGHTHLGEMVSVRGRLGLSPF